LTGSLLTRVPKTRSFLEGLPLRPPQLDPSLTLTRTQYPAMVGKRGNRKTLIYAEFASLCNAQQPLPRTRSWSRGKRFESARRLSFLPAKSVKTKSPRHEHRGLCQQYVSSRLSRSLVLCIGLLRVVAGTAGSVCKSSSVECLTDVPEFWRVRHRRKTFARVPRETV
jgi:hypothetical protein